MTAKAFKAIRIRLYPNKTQQRLLNKNIGACRWVYNYFWKRRNEYYDRTGGTLSYANMNKELTALKKNPKYAWLREVDSTTLQSSLRNLDQAFRNFYRRLKLGISPVGFPQLKKYEEGTSFRCAMNMRVEKGHLKIGKHGWLKFRGSQALYNKKIQSITVTKVCGKYYASCLVEADPNPPHIHQHQSIGIDLGVVQPLTCVYSNSKQEIRTKVIGVKERAHLKRLEQRRKWYQRQLARKQKGSQNRSKCKSKVARAFEKEKNYRSNFVEQTSKQISTRFETIVFEDLSLKNMTRSSKGTIDSPGKNVAQKSGLNRELLRLSLSHLVTRTIQKATERGGKVVLVDPKYTSQTCNSCGTIDKASRKSQSQFCCTACSHKDNADRNAALNILQRGLLQVA